MIILIDGFWGSGKTVLRSLLDGHKDLYVSPSQESILSTFYRNQKRMIISVNKIKDSVEDLIELKSNDQISYLQQYFYFIHLVDWISVTIAEQESVDPDDITLINYLKDQLKET